MSEINFNSIFDGVSLALHAAFPPPVQIHGGEVKQGLVPGDFNVTMPSGSQAQQVGRHYKRKPTLDVIYYPREGEAECYDIAERLTAVLESITTPQGDIIHATSCEWTVSDGVLHMLVSYAHHVYRPYDEVKMEALKIDQRG